MYDEYNESYSININHALYSLPCSLAHTILELGTVNRLAMELSGFLNLHLQEIQNPLLPRQRHTLPYLFSYDIYAYPWSWKWPAERVWNIQSSAVLTPSNMAWYCTRHCRNGGRISIRVWATKDTPYFALTGELWDVFCEYIGEIWPRYNGTALNYIFLISVHQILSQACDIGGFLRMRLQEYKINADKPTDRPTDSRYIINYLCHSYESWNGQN